MHISLLVAAASHPHPASCLRAISGWSIWVSPRAGNGFLWRVLLLQCWTWVVSGCPRTQHSDKLCLPQKTGVTAGPCSSASHRTQVRAAGQTTPLQTLSGGTGPHSMIRAAVPAPACPSPSCGSVPDPGQKVHTWPSAPLGAPQLSPELWELPQGYG